MRVQRAGIFMVLLVALVSGACQEHKLADREEVLWGKVGSWSGRGPLQTSSFQSDTGVFRVRWETKGAEAGAFKLVLYSAVSGRPLLDAVDHKGPGGGTVDLSEDPRVFYFVVESSDLDWSFTAEEGVKVTLRPRAN